MGNGWALRGVCVEGVVDLPRSRPQEAWAPIVSSLGKKKKRIRLYIYHCADNIKMVAASEACLVYTF